VRTPVRDLLGTDVPIVQAPIGSIVRELADEMDAASARLAGITT
jgi:hypothetical protein